MKRERIDEKIIKKSKRILEPLYTFVKEFRIKDVEDSVIFAVKTLLKLSSGAHISQVLDQRSLRPIGVLLIMTVLIIHSVNNIFTR